MSYFKSMHCQHKQIFKCFKIDIRGDGVSSHLGKKEVVTEAQKVDFVQKVVHRPESAENKIKEVIRTQLSMALEIILRSLHCILLIMINNRVSCWGHGLFAKNVGSKDKRRGRKTSQDLAKQIQVRNEMVVMSNVVTVKMMENFLLDLRNQVVGMAI